MFSLNQIKKFNNYLYPFLVLILLVFGTFFLLFNGIEYSWKWLGASLLAFFLFDNLGVQIGVHKEMAHQSFRTSKFIRRILATLSIFTGQGSPITWVAVHMSAHHPYYDTEKDAHSPNQGKFYAFLGWYWRVDVRKIRYGVAKQYIKDPYLVSIHNYHVYLLLLYWMSLAIMGKEFLFYLGFIPAIFSICLVGIVNSFLHYEGKFSRLLFLKYQNHKNDQTYNSLIIGILTMGLGLHNNHHKKQSLRFYDEKWYEIDLSRLIIPLIEKSKK